MRVLLVAAMAVVGFPAVAAADPIDTLQFDNASPDADQRASWNEIGVVRARIATVTGDLVEGVAVRFAPRVAVSHNVYLGGELDTGTLNGRVAPNASLRTTGGETAPSAVSGKFGGVAAVVGVRARFGMVSAGGELAVGLHAADLRDAYGQELGAIDNETYVEGRARLDLWLTRRVTVGTIVGVGLDDSRDLTAGIMLGYHFGNYDGMR